jgi:glucose-1-phosphate thymidylyltransferase
MRVIIPVAGAGVTLRPHTHTNPKPLIPIAGKPILGHIIDYLLAAGLDQFVFVIGHLGEKIQEYVQGQYGSRVGATFVRQEPRLGLAHGIGSVREAVGDNEPLLILLGDTIIDADLRAILAEPGSIVCGQEVDDPRNFGVVEVGSDGFVTRLVEKPAIPKSNIALVGLYKIMESRMLFNAIDHLVANKQRTRNEYQLTDALQHLVDAGIRIRVMPVTNWFDCGQKQVLLSSNRILLGRIPEAERILSPTEGCVVIPPVYIAPGCVIHDSIIGPNVAIADNARIQGSIVRESILGAYSTLRNISLHESVIGNDTSLTGHAHSLNIGDNAEIDFSS